jgi:flagellar motor switch protein FliN
MIVDQSEIDSLLNEAVGLAAAMRPPDPPPPRTAPPPAAPPSRAAHALPADLRRVLKVRVPVIVQLATRRMRISAVRDLSVGAIIEFEKSVEDQLELRVNNRTIGRGVCVKCGENFGLKIVEICSPAERVRSLGE